MTQIPGMGEAETPQIAALADRMMQAYRAGAPYPVLTREEPFFDLDTAYLVQSAFARRRLHGGGAGGFKVGVGDVPAQDRLAVHHPLIAVLTREGRREPGSTLSLAAYKRMIVETEICLIVGEAITEELPDVAALKRKIATIGPAFEMADMRFAPDASFRGSDMVAGNVGAAEYVVGPQHAVGSVDLAQVTISLSRDGTVIKEVPKPEAGADPFPIALWFVNCFVRRGWHPQPGHVLLTGLRGAPTPGEPGRYVADYGPLGRVEISVA